MGDNNQPDPAILELARVLAREAARRTFAEATNPSAEPHPQPERSRREKRYSMRVEKLSDCARVTLIEIKNDKGQDEHRIDGSIVGPSLDKSGAPIVDTDLHQKDALMISDEATPLVIDTAKSFVSLMTEVAPDWQKAYLRFSGWGSVSESSASYVHSLGVEIIDALKHKAFFRSISRSGGDLLASLGKAEGIYLLTVDSNLDYEIKFEYEDSEKWQISKIGGGTGIPEGLE